MSGAGRALHWGVVLAVAVALWLVVRPVLESRRVFVPIALPEPAGRAWSLEWSEHVGGARNGVWLDLGEHDPEGGELELRPSGQPVIVGRRDYSFHVYEIRRGSWRLTREALKRQLALCQTHPDAAREQGWEFQGRWVAGVAGSGIIYQGPGPGLIRVPVPRGSGELEVESERVPGGGEVEVAYRGGRARVDAHAEAWAALTIRPDIAVVGQSETRELECPLPSTAVRELRLNWTRSPAGAANVGPIRIEQKILGLSVGQRELHAGRAAVTGGEVNAVGVLQRAQPDGNLTWPLDLGLGVWVNLAGVVGAVLPAWLLVWVLAGWGRSGPLVEAAPGRFGRPFWVLLGAVAALHAWFASWAVMLYLPDSVDYARNALQLSAERSLTHFDAWRLPGVSFMLLPLEWLSGRPEELFGWVQAGMGVLMAVLVYDLVRRSSPRGTALVAMALTGLSPVMLAWERHTITETPTAFLAVLALWLSMMAGPGSTARTGRRIAFAAGAGVVMALACYTRGNAVVLLAGLPAFLLMLERARPKRGVALGAVLLLSAGAVLTPWILRNASVYGKPRMIIGSGYARLIFLWYTGNADVNQTRALDFDAWRAARAGRERGEDAFAFMQRLESAGDDDPVGIHPWVAKDGRCGVVAAESRARNAPDAAAVAGWAMLSHLGLYQHPAHPSFRNTDFYCQPHRGTPFPGTGTNWVRDPSAQRGSCPEALMDNLYARTVRVPPASPLTTGVFDAWYRAFDWAKPAIGLLAVAGALWGWRRGRPVVCASAMLFGANAAGFAWVYLCGETRYSEPFFPFLAIAAAWGLREVGQLVRPVGRGAGAVAGGMAGPSGVSDQPPPSAL